MSERLFAKRNVMDLPHLLVTNTMPGINGETVMAAELAGGMSRRGYRVTLATRSTSQIIDYLEGVSVEVLPVSFFKRLPRVAWTLPRDMRRLATYIRDEDVRLVHCHSSNDTWTAALTLWYSGLDVPLIRTKHNVKRIRTHLMNRWLYARAIDHFVAPSCVVEKSLRDSGLVAKERINRIQNGISVDRIRRCSKEKDEARRALKIPPGAEIVTCVSRLSPDKDPATLVRAVMELTKTRPKLRLLAVGGGDEQELAQMNEIASGNEAIEFWGHRQDVPSILAATDVFVQPSLAEAFGLAPLEAMLPGVPTIVSDAEGFQEFAEDGVNCLVFPRRDVTTLAKLIERLLTDQALRTRIAAAGERSVRDHFTTERMLEDIEKLYTRVLGMRKTVPE